MPEAAVNKDNEAIFMKDKIWSALYIEGVHLPTGNCRSYQASA